MTDNEIIKALEHCKQPTGKHDCENCPYVSSRGMCTTNMLNDTIDLINRQKAEIDMLKDIIVKNNRDILPAVAIMIEENRERSRLEKIRYLEGEIVWLQSMNQAKLDTIHDLRTRLETAKPEAIKEFAERLCEGRVSNDPVVIAVKVELEEMTVNYESTMSQVSRERKMGNEKDT